MESSKKNVAPISLTPMHAVERKTTVPVDWSPLNQHIADQYGDLPDKYSTEIEKLTSMREEMRCVTGKDVSSRNILYAYAGQIDLLMLHFNVSDDPDKGAQVAFTWTDSLNNEATTQASLAFEKASVVHAIGSIMSHLACAESRNDGDGLKKAFNYFQCSAGLFNFIAENFLYAPSLDMSQEVLAIYRTMMLAQAQECFYEKAVMDSKSPKIICKLSSQLAIQFASLRDLAGEHPATAVKFTPFRLSAETKAKYYHAITQFYKALECEQATRIGEGVARMKYAETILKDALKTGSFSSSGMTKEFLQSFQTILIAKTKALEKDNDLVYHDTIPATESLDSVAGLSMVKPITLREMDPSVIELIGDDLFKKLVPMHVHEVSSLYSEEKAKIVRSHTQHAQQADDIVVQLLASLNLPAAVQNVRQNRNSSGPSEHVFALKRSLEKDERDKKTEELFEALKVASSTAADMISKAPLELEMEQKECESMRVKYGDRWTQEPSHLKSKYIWDLIKKHRAAIEQARSSDQQLKDRFNSALDMINILRRNDQAFSSAYPSINLMDSPYDDENMNEIEGLVKNLEILKKERQAFLKELRDKAQNDDINDLLILNKNKENEVIQEELKKYAELTGNVKKNLAGQEKLIGKLQKQFDIFTSCKNQDSYERDRKELESKLESTALEVQEIRKNLIDGTKYYNSLVNAIAEVMEACSLFSKRRAGERHTLIASIEKDIVKNDQEAIKEQLENLERKNSLSISQPPSQRSPYQNQTFPSPMNYGTAPNQNQQQTIPPSMNYGTTPMAPSQSLSHPMQGLSLGTSENPPNMVNPYRPDVSQQKPPSGYSATYEQRPMEQQQLQSPYGSQVRPAPAAPTYGQHPTAQQQQQPQAYGSSHQHPSPQSHPTPPMNPMQKHSSNDSFQGGNYATHPPNTYTQPIYGGPHDQPPRPQFNQQQYNTPPQNHHQNGPPQQQQQYHRPPPMSNYQAPPPQQAYGQPQYPPQPSAGPPHPYQNNQPPPTQNYRPLPPHQQNMPPYGGPAYAGGYQGQQQQQYPNPGPPHQGYMDQHKNNPSGQQPPSGGGPPPIPSKPTSLMD